MPQSTHFYTDCDGTQFTLDMPDHWTRVASRAPICMHDGASGASLQITPTSLSDTQNAAANLRHGIEVVRDHALSRSVERSIELETFSVDSKNGYYFSTQDRAPEPHGWAFMTYGAFIAEGCVIQFTILSHHPPPEGTKDSMTALASMRVLRPASLTHTFDCAGGLRIVLALPPNWVPVTHEIAPICLSDRLNNDFLHITALPPPKAEQLRSTLRDVVQTHADHVMVGSMDVLPFNNIPGDGYYYFERNYNRPPENEEFITGGMFAVKEHVFRFEILSRHTPPDGTKDAMDALRNLQIIPPESPVERSKSDIEAGLQTFRLFCALDELKELVERNDCSGVAGLSMSVLALPHDRIPAADKNELLLPFNLNLAWALAVSWEARSTVKPDDVIGTVESAVDYLATRKEPARLASALNNLGSLYMNCERSDFDKCAEKALQAYMRSVSIYRALGTPEDMKNAGHVLLHASNVYLRRDVGDLAVNIEVSLKLAEVAVTLQRQCGNERSLAVALSHRGRVNVNREKGINSLNWDRALEDFSSAYKIWQKLYLSDPSVENSIIEDAINLGAARIEIGGRTRSTNLIESGIEVLEPIHDKVWEKKKLGWIFPATIELGIAYDYLLRECPSRRDIFNKSMLLLDRLKDWITKQRTSSDSELWALARVHELRGIILTTAAGPPHDADLEMLRRADEAIARATESFRKFGLAYRTVPSRIKLADAYHRAGETNLAEKLSVVAASDARDHASKAISKSSLAAMYRPVYAACQQLAFFQAKRGALVDSILTLESALAPTLRKRAHFGESKTTLEPPLQERFSRLSRQYEALTGFIESPNIWFSEEAIEARISHVKLLDTEIAELAGPRMDDALPDINAIARAIPQNGALVVPLVWGGIWICLDNEGIEKPRVTKVVCPNFWALVNELAGKLPFWDSVGQAFLEEAETVVMKAVSEFDNGLQSFGASIVRPLSLHLNSLDMKRGSPLVIVGHGLLSHIPIHAATWIDGCRTELFGSLYDLTVCPSLTWLTKTSPDRGSKNARRSRIVLVADSKGNAEGSWLLGQLIAQTSNDRDCVLLSQGKASKAALINALPAATHLHIAGHSRCDIEMPFQSTVDLADEELTVADLVSQGSGAPSVVILSSCSSGVGSGFQGTSENWGFPFALHLWGVRTVIANLWPTLDIVMLLFFSEYYRADGAMLYPITAFKVAQSYLRKVDAEAARARLHEICHKYPEDLAVLEGQLNYIVSRYGESAPFENPYFWAATFCSGAPDDFRIVPSGPSTAIV